MARDAELLEIARQLLAEDDYERTAETLLARLAERCGAASGFLVVPEEGSFRRKFEVGEPGSEHRFSRTLVREVIDSRRSVHLGNLALDPRFARVESAREMGPASVLAVPLRHGGQVYGAVYLEHRRPGAFTAEAVDFCEGLAELAGLFLKRASEREALRRRLASLEDGLSEGGGFAGIVTRDPGLLTALRFLAQVAPSDAPVLIGGETGTGKELAARLVHVSSPRRERPLVALHCAALPATLFEAELFGHAAGAFTDARRDRPGRLATAHGGTLFLDEVGEIPLEVQAKLLRFLQFGEIQRVGADRVERVDVRVVAATHRDLKALVREGRFREDLYFRLKVLDVMLPPLRERRGDLPLLLDFFLGRHWRRPGEVPRFTPEALAALAAYPFPGNVRELAGAVERACLLARSPELGIDLLPAEIAAALPGPPPAPRFQSWTAEELYAAKESQGAAVEREFLTTLLARSGGNVSRAARESGLHRAHLHKLLARHGLGASREDAPAARPPP